MKRRNKLKLGLIKLIADDAIILHDFEIVNHSELLEPGTLFEYQTRVPTGRSTITLQIETIKK